MPERKAALYGTLPANGRSRYAGQFAESAAELRKLPVQLELEGIVAKDSSVNLYRRPVSTWLKIKADADAERERNRRHR